MKGGSVFDGVCVSIEPWGKSPMQEVEGLSLVDNIVMPVEESLRIQGRTQTSGMENFVKPFQRTSIESRVDETGQKKEKNIFLAKPSADLPTAEKEGLVAAKESAYNVFAVWGVGNIEGKKVWRYFICQVSATSEADLKQHFTGSKHRSKRAVLKAEKSAATAITGDTVQISGIEPLMPTPPPIATAIPLGGHGTSVSTLPEKKKKKKAMVKENFAFWCKMCNAGANNKYLMEAHKKGTLKKLTLKGFDVLKDQLLACRITSADILKGVVSLIFDKAVLEPTFCLMYAQLFSDLDANLPPFPSDQRGGKDITLKRVLLNNCQMAFKGAEKLRGELREMTATEQEIERSDKETLLNLRFRGSIRLIGELFKQKMVQKR